MTYIFSRTTKYILFDLIKHGNIAKYYIFRIRKPENVYKHNGKNM